MKGGVLAGVAAGGIGFGAAYFGYGGSVRNPLRVGVIGTGDEGNVLIGAINPNYLDVVAIADIRPYVEKHYRTKNERGDRAIAGLSMGGAQSLNISLRHLDQFAYIGVFSSGIFGSTEAFKKEHAAVLAKGADWNKQIRLFWVGIGKDDFLLESNANMLSTLKEAGIQTDFRETPGGHTWKNWRIYLRDFLPRLFRERP